MTVWDGSERRSAPRASTVHPLRRLTPLDRGLVALLGLVYLFAAAVVADADVVRRGPYATVFPVLFAAAGVALLTFVIVDRAVTYALSGALAVLGLVTRAVALVFAYVREDALIGPNAIELRVAIYLGFAAVLARLWAFYGAIPEPAGAPRSR